MKRQVKTKAWISEIEVYDKPDGHTLAMQCQTPDLKRKRCVNLVGLLD